uniref:Uncharacterized protein n=1 Tax=Cyprinus carpio TaxID=7962 RepID=A0A8C1QFS9_CYPCA
KMAESQKCLGKGSPAPGPVPKKHIQLYSMRFCPFAQWTRLVFSFLIWESPITLFPKSLPHVFEFLYLCFTSCINSCFLYVLIDYMMWPWFERMEMMDLNNVYKNLKKWTEHMLEDPPVKATVFSTDNYKVFYKSYMEGTPDYDYGL